MFKLLIDTCVWLKMAEDQYQQATLGVLEELVRQGEVSLIVPSIIVDEVGRNKERIIKASQQSITSILKNARRVVNQFGGDANQKHLALQQLNEVDYRIPSLGEAVAESLRRVEALLADAAPLPVTDAVKLRAAERAIAKKAPFHIDGKNSMADAVLIETYADILTDPSPDVRFAFVTHNYTDFSLPQGDSRMPHPDLAVYFSRPESFYSINLSELLKRIEPELVSDVMVQEEWTEEPRRLTEIVDVIGELTDKVWYNRHQVLRQKIERGKVKIVEKPEFPVKNHDRRPVQRDIWEGALKSAERVEQKYGLENLGPWTDFDWGMINGKLSALRWVLGEDWDSLYT